MFVIDADETVQFQNLQIDFPDHVSTIEFTLPPYSMTKQKSGAYVIATYMNSVNFCNGSSERLTDQYIDTNIYQPLKIQTANSYIKLSDGIKKASQLLGKTGDDVVWVKSVDGVKRLIHKHSFCIVELKANSSFCACPQYIEDRKYVITESGSVLDQNLSKGLLACGYDESSVMMLGSSGKSYGSCGFIKMSVDVLQDNMIKACCVKNLYY